MVLGFSTHMDEMYLDLLCLITKYTWYIAKCNLWKKNTIYEKPSFDSLKHVFRGTVSETKESI